MFVLICPTVFEIQGFEISKKIPPHPLFSGNIATTVVSRAEGRARSREVNGKSARPCALRLTRE